MHIALAGCLKAPPIAFGVTKDTGGHIAYVVDAAIAQAAETDVESVVIVTRAFDRAGLDPVHACPREAIGPQVAIHRVATANRDYLEKSDIVSDLTSFIEAFLAELGRAVRPDVIHAHFADAATIAAAVRERFGIPFFYTPHALALGGDRCDLTADPARIAAERVALASADGVIVSSHDEAERQIAAYDVADVAPRVHRVAPGIPGAASVDGALPFRLDQVLADPTKPMLLAVARPVRKKNLAALAEAYASSAELQARANLVIVAGQQNLPLCTAEELSVLSDLRRVASEPALRGRIALPGRHTTSELQALYREAARCGGALVAPALHEPFGLTLLEAAAAGLPVVATRHGGCADIVAELGHGIIVNPADRDDIVGACLRLLRDRSFHRDLAQAGLRNRDAYSWSRYARRSVELYRDVLQPARPRKRDVARLLACDLDGTLTGCPMAARRFKDWAANRNIAFVVATGRSLSDARAVIAAWGLPEPDAFITSVGTALYRRNESDGSLYACRRYAENLARDWSRADVLAIAERIGLAPQPPANQSSCKLSYFGTAADARRVEVAVQAAGLGARVVFSHERYIDILAPRAGKAAAIGAYARDLGLSLADCLAAGDSGNDADMLERCGVAIVVANASRDLDGLAPRQGLVRTRLPFADGVLEGLARAGLGEGAFAPAAAA